MTSNCVYISAKTRLLSKNLILRQARAQNSILCDSFTGISNTRYRRMVKSDFQLDDFLVDAAFIFLPNKMFAMLSWHAVSDLYEADSRSKTNASEHF